MAIIEKQLTLYFPVETHDALIEFAEITGADDVEKLIQDCVRTTEWLVWQQSQKRTVAALSKEQLALLEKHGLGVKCDAKVDNYIKPDKGAQAAAYFEKAPSKMIRVKD